jgi:hypothetical protein
VLCRPLRAAAAEETDAGFAYDEFDLTLEPGHRTEIAGPFYYDEQKQETLKIWALPPVLSYSSDPATELLEINIAYPVFSYVRYGQQYRWQFFQLLAFAGGPSQNEPVRKRTTIFPLYFHQRSSDPTQEYTAIGPFYGHLQKRLFRDEITYIMFPFYSKTLKKNVVTRNYVYPFGHVREGDGLDGWQIWPFYGVESKGITTKTNGFGDVELVPGYHSSFAMWPIFANQETGLGTDNPQSQRLIFPFYNVFRSPLRDSTIIMWPFFTFASGTKTISRVWPFYSHAYNTNLQSDVILWPLYTFSHIRSAPLDRARARIMFFLYSDLNEKDTARNLTRRRVDVLPLFTWRREYNGNTRLQIFAPLEPVLPANHNIEREYSPFWSVWRSEKNPKTGHTSQSLFWNLYRRETTPQSRKVSLFFGLYQSRKSEEGTHTRLFYIPLR